MPIQTISTNNAPAAIGHYSQKSTDAVVEVRMGLKDTHKNEVTGSATSPDVIVASINAFEKGYNMLYRKSKFPEK